MLMQFIFGNPIPPERFINRQHELRRIVGRITTGQSIALTGEPRTGKTSLLEYLRAPGTRADLYGPLAEKLIFYFLDAQILGSQFTQSQFWEYALQPLYERLVEPGNNTQIAKAYQTCLDNNFGTFVLERLAARIGGTGYHLVLLLDEFDSLLHHPVLNSAEFFGGLRSLVSRSQGGLVMVTANRKPLAWLNHETQELSRTGSPYFNFMDEITLGPFSGPAISKLLAPADAQFDEDDRRFIQRVAGGHPYLVQVTASALWEAKEDLGDPAESRLQAGQELFQRAAPVISDTWRLWTPEVKKAFTAVALDHCGSLLGERTFDVEEMVAELTNLGPEVRSLERQGYILQSNGQTSSGWRIGTEAFLWWLSEELLRTVRDDTSFDDWFRAQEWEGLMKRGEKERFNQAAQALHGLIKEGVEVFIRSAAEGITKKLI